MNDLIRIIEDYLPLLLSDKITIKKGGKVYIIKYTI